MRRIERSKEELATLIKAELAKYARKSKKIQKYATELALLEIDEAKQEKGNEN